MELMASPRSLSYQTQNILFLCLAVNRFLLMLSPQSPTSEKEAEDVEWASGTPSPRYKPKINELQGKDGVVYF